MTLPHLFGPFLEFLFEGVACFVFRSCPAGKFIEKSTPYEKKDTPYKQFEHPRVRQIKHPYVIADKDAGEGTEDHNPGKRPRHSSFLDVSIDAARYGDDI